MTEQEKKAFILYRLSKAQETFDEVQLHIQNKLWNTAVNRLYYACYYAVCALLVSKEIETKTHTGVRQMFGLHFIKPGIIDANCGRFYSKLFDIRQKGDYDDLVNLGEEDILALVKPAQTLILEIKRVVI